MTLRVVHSPDPDAVGRTFALDGARWTIGRAAPGLGAIRDGRLSREHVRLRIDASSGYVVEDLGSRNGTFVDGLRLDKPVTATAGLVVSAGDTIAVVDVAPAQERFPRGVTRAAQPVPEIVGVSLLSEAWRETVALIAGASGPVLLLGPTGSGKEVTARAIHRLSGRSGPMVPVNCSAIPEALAESELFGHRKGAFSGAVDDRAGLFLEAAGGTLFLDELGDLPSALQPKLLRVLDDHVVQRLGGGPQQTVDVRIIAATQVDIAETGFRRDLFARLADWTLELPPLAERPADVLALFDHFLRTEASGARQPTYTAELAEALLLHDWPMNARELRRLARQLLTIAPEGEWDLPLLPVALQRPVMTRGHVSSAPDREAMQAALQQARGNVSKAAELLGKDRKSLYRWMRRFGIDAKTYR